MNVFQVQAFLQNEFVASELLKCTQNVQVFASIFATALALHGHAEVHAQHCLAWLMPPMASVLAHPATLWGPMWTILRADRRPLQSFACIVLPTHVHKILQMIQSTDSTCP